MDLRQAKGLAEMYEAGGITLAETARQAGMAISTLRERVKVQGLPMTVALTKAATLGGRTHGRDLETYLYTSPGGWTGTGKAWSVVTGLAENSFHQRARKYGEQDARTYHIGPLPKRVPNANRWMEKA